MAEEKEKRPPLPNYFRSTPLEHTSDADIFTRRYLDSLLVEMRIIDSDLASTETEFFGHKLNTPVMFGVMGGRNLAAAEAPAVVENNSVMWMGRIEPEEMKDSVAMGAKIVRIAKPYVDNDRFIEELKSAEEAGAIAVGSDIDHAYGNEGGYDGHGPFTFGPKSTQQLKEVVSSLNVPFIAKGVLSVQDAVKCREAGVAGIVISHHHNIMKYAVPPLMILPDIRKAVGDDYPVYVDCGIDTGADAFKALALGADGVCTVRAPMQVLSGGAEALTAFLKEMTGELRHYLNRTSSPDIKHIDPTVIHQINV